MKILDDATALSVRGKHWAFRVASSDEVSAFARKTNLDDLTARLLMGRGIEAADVETFLEPKLRDQMQDPSSLQDMDKAVDVVLDAIKSHKNIVIFADYDVDGATSAAQLVYWARSIGYEFGIYVPDRVKEGYGPNIAAFKQLKSSGTDLVITVDCGAAAEQALKAATDLDLDIVVVDHHIMHGDLPPCAALINPNRHDCGSGLGHLAAAGVVFMFVVALNRGLRRRGMDAPLDPMSVLGYAALGTVCDVVPLHGINRVFVTQGLKSLSQSAHCGIAALAQVAGTQAPFSSYDMGFVLGPRINAGGRIGQADMGAKLLTTPDPVTASHLAETLETTNQERKLLQSKMLSEALKHVNQHLENDPVLVVSQDEWHPGIIGVVAGRLKDKFEKPAIVVGVNEEGVAKGSGRSIKGVDLGQAIIAAQQAGIISQGGGHAMAGGLTMQTSNIELLRQFLCERLAQYVRSAQSKQSLRLDGLLAPRALTPDLLDIIDKVGPYGAGNPEPVFVVTDMKVSYAKRLNGGHVRASFKNASGEGLNTICFRADESGLSEALLSPNPVTYHVAGYVKRNLWQGQTRIDFHLVDLMDSKNQVF